MPERRHRLDRSFEQAVGGHLDRVLDTLGIGERNETRTDRHDFSIEKKRRTGVPPLCETTGDHHFELGITTRGAKSGDGQGEFGVT